MKVQIIKIFILLLLLFQTINVYTQTIQGRVWGNKEPLEGVTVKWENTSIGTITDSRGNFEIDADNISGKNLHFQFIGYKPHVINTGDKNFIEVTLKQDSIETEVIDVESEKKSTYIEDKDVKREVITSQELVKDACCDLSGCFGRNSSVDVAVTDIITDSKELKVLGMEGVYTQLLVENMPVLWGLNTKYGISSIPGTLIDKIMISKGSDSVLQGYESISGIINVLLKDRDNSEKVFLNGFVNSMLEKQFNGNFSGKVGKNWNTLLSIHTAQKGNQTDINNDTFLDHPQITRYMAYNKWRLGDFEDKTQFMIAGKILSEERIGGQKGFDEKLHEGSNTVYGQTVNIKSGDIYSRFSYGFKNGSELKVLGSLSYYDMKSFYGITKYDGKQTGLNVNAVYEFELGNESYLKTGFSYKREEINENISFTNSTDKTYAGEYKKLESVPGIFAEHAINLFDEKFSLISGIRFDHHNKHKMIYTPRILARLQLTPETVVRASFGTGFRTINLFNEYSTVMASSRDIVIAEELQPEKMMNYGIDILQYFNFSNVSGSLNIDAYRTDFSNKIIPDYDTDPSEVKFSNLNGSSASNVLQTELNLNLFQNFDMKLAYKYLDIKYTQNGITLEQPFVSKHRFTSTLSYIPDNNTWGASAGLQWFGKQRLPSTVNNPAEYRKESESKPFMLLNAQLNKNFKYFEIYGGIENILDFKQADPIISADDPFSKYFDTSFIWGPTKGREIYAGFRLKFN